MSNQVISVSTISLLRSLTSDSKAAASKAEHSAAILLYIRGYPHSAKHGKLYDTLGLNDLIIDFCHEFGEESNRIRRDTDADFELLVKYYRLRHSYRTACIYAGWTVTAMCACHPDVKLFVTGELWKLINESLTSPTPQS